jgi:fused signal recognition particle receptor
MFGFFKSKKVLDEAFIETLEEDLINADLGITTFSFIMNKLRKNHFNQEISYDELKNMVANYIKEDLAVFFEKDHIFINKKPFIIQVIGTNGSGKTTSIAKLAHMLKALEYKTLLVPCDTFRAGAMDQLKSWADKLQVDFFDEQNIKDPSALAFKACMFAQDNNYDVVVIDTAGRQDSNLDLMNELKKMDNVLKKVSPTAPHECLLVVDANMGQSAVSQSHNFNKFANITGIIATKMESIAKAGVLVNIVKKVLSPIYFIGIGENEDDYKKFNIDEYLQVLLNQDNTYEKNKLEEINNQEAPSDNNFDAKINGTDISSLVKLNDDVSKITINNQQKSFNDFMADLNNQAQETQEKKSKIGDLDEFLKSFNLKDAQNIANDKYNNQDVEDMKNKVNLEEIKKIISKYEK